MTDKNRLHNLSKEVKEVKYYVLDELKLVEKKSETFWKRRFRGLAGLTG